MVVALNLNTLKNMFRYLLAFIGLFFITMALFQPESEESRLKTAAYNEQIKVSVASYLQDQEVTMKSLPWLVEDGRINSDVLGKFYRQGVISYEQYEQLKRQPIVTAKLPKDWQILCPPTKSPYSLRGLCFYR